MKKVLIIALFFISFSASAQDKQPIDKSLAKANQKFGLYIFNNSTPVAPYEYLGTVNSPSVSWSGSADEMWKSILKRIHKEYPSTQAIIMNDDSQKIECIKFKE